MFPHLAANVGDDLAACAAFQCVVARAPKEKVEAIVAAQDVVARRTIQCVLASTASDHVIARKARDRIIVRRRRQRGGHELVEAKNGAIPQRDPFDRAGGLVPGGIECVVDDDLQVLARQDEAGAGRANGRGGCGNEGTLEVQLVVQPARVFESLIVHVCVT